MAKPRESNAVLSQVPVVFTERIWANFWTCTWGVERVTHFPLSSTHAEPWACR